MFIGQSADGGKTLLGYHFKWDPTEGEMDIIEKAKLVDKVNKSSKHGGRDSIASSKKIKFYVWEQYYLVKHTAVSYKDPEKSEITLVYQGSSEKKLFEF